MKNNNKTSILQNLSFKGQDFLVKIKLSHSSLMPIYASSHSSGADLMADIPEAINLEPGKIILVSTGVFLDLMDSINNLGQNILLEAQIRSRSGLSLKGIIVLNSPGTIDMDYNGEIRVILSNVSQENFVILPKMRIAQLVFTMVTKVNFTQIDEIIPKTSNTRQNKGFGSSGLLT